MFNMGRYGVSTIGIVLETKEIICRIPQQENYLPKREWLALSNKEDYFTLFNEDIIVLGEVEDEIDEYTAGKHSTDLVTKYKQYDECLIIDAYVDNVQTGVGLAHYRVTGK